MKQRLDNVLAVTMTCPTNIEIGDVVIINAAKTIIKNNAAGSLKIVGTVCAHQASATECTIETRFRERRDDRVSGASVSVGAFVFNSAGKVINYDANTHDPAAIAGLVITTANAGDVVVETLEL